MKANVFIFSVALAFFSTMACATSSAPSNSLEKAERLVQLTNQDNLVNEQIDNIVSQLAKEPMFEAYKSEFKNLLLKTINQEKIKRNLIAGFDDLFTDDELDTLIQFYQSPLGQKLLQSTPALTKRVIADFENEFDKSQSEFQALILKIALSGSSPKTHNANDTQG